MTLIEKLNLVWKFLFLAVFTYGVISMTCCKQSCSSSQQCCKAGSTQLEQPCSKGKQFLLELDLKKIVIMLSIGIGLTPNTFSPYINIAFWTIAVILSGKGDIWVYELLKRRKGTK